MDSSTSDLPIEITIDLTREHIKETLHGYGDTHGDKDTYLLYYYGPHHYEQYGYYPSGYDSTLGVTSARRSFPVKKIVSDFFLSRDLSAPQPFTMTDSGFGYLYGTDELPGIDADADSMDGHQFEKRVRAARIGLPPTKAGSWTAGAGFLDIDVPFIHKIQQRYIKWKSYRNIAPTAETHDTWLNIDIGFEGDTDGIPFEEYYVDDYPTAPWTSIEESYKFLARVSQFMFGDISYTYSDLTDDPMAVSAITVGLAFGGASALYTGTDSMFDGEYSSWTDYSFTRTPINEVFYESHVDNLTAGSFFYEDMPDTAADDWWASFDMLGGSPSWDSVGMGGKYLPSHTAVESSIVNHTFGSGAGETEVAVFSKVSYDYEKSGDGKEVWEDIIKRFKSLDYVKAFSSELISHRLDQVSALLTTTISREADIKMQKNEPLRHTLATAMADDYSTMDTPDTSVSSTGIESYSSADPMGTTGGGTY